jgi:hypothetical protein
MTILEAQVAAEKWGVLEQTFNEAVVKLDPGLTQTFLLHNSREPNMWRIATVWASRQALDTMRQSGATPTGVVIFRAAGAEPVLSIFDVTSSAAA